MTIKSKTKARRRKTNHSLIAYPVILILVGEFMKPTHHLIKVVLLTGFLFTFSFAQNQKPISASPPQEKSGSVPDEDKVYSPKDVDTKAVIKNTKELDPGKIGPSSDCSDGARIRLRVVLHKSGTVTAIKTIKSASCSLDEKAIKTVHKIKFTPAIKNGVAVSQYMTMEFGIHKY